MRKYIIFDYQTDKRLGEVEAKNIIDAEIKASAKFDIASDQLYAISESMVYER